ncbi:MAG: glycosyltransferase family 39 protein [Patescibacteria group bacterium]
MSVKKGFLVGILIIAAFLRFYQLGSNPPSLTWDEAAWGYNAYSLGTDGRDEFGRFLPLDYLESFGDFKPPVYAYLDVLPIKFFGLNEFAVRFPSALFGVLTVLLTYFLVKRLFQNSKNKDLYALFSSLFLALSPWHIMLSRAAFEANVATFFIVLGVLLFLIAIQKNKWYLIFSFTSFAISLYTFNTARIVSPLLVFLLVFIFKKDLWDSKKQFIIASLFALVLILPTAKFLLSPQASLRFKEVNIFSDPGVVSLANEEIKNDDNAFWSKIIHNRRFIFTTEYLKHYFDNLTPSFLFIKGDGNPKFSTQDVGLLYLFDLPFLLIGTIFLFKKKEGKWYLLPLWLILGMIPAATARETPHALRIETTIPTFQILSAYGFVLFLNKFSKKKYLIVLALLFLTINLTYFLHGYLAHYAKEFSGEWQYGYRESIDYVEENKANYSQINITQELGRPYIYYLFYSKYDPRKYREMSTVKRDAFGFVTVEGFDKYKFAKDVNVIKSKDALYINIPANVPQNAQIKETFYLLNSNPSLVAYTL